MSANKQPPQGNVSEVVSTFAKLGSTSFGGPAAHIGFFRKELVEKKGWVSENHFAQLLAICQFLPGPASSQLGFALGLHRAGWAGAIAAFIAFTFPSALLLFLFATALPYIPEVYATTLVHGLKLVACAVVADAVFTMAKSLCPDKKRQSIAILSASFILLSGASWVQIAIVLFGATCGLVLYRGNHAHSSDSIKVDYGKGFGLWMLAIFALLFFALPLLTSQHNLIAIAEIFYRAGSLVFGGGHVVLPLLETSTVDAGWLTKESFLAGYGASQAVPGPMFAFASFLGAEMAGNNDVALSALVALMAVFLPGFLLLGAILPFWQKVSQSANASKAIMGVNAAVVGILGAALYNPIFTNGILNTTDLVIALIGFTMLRVWQLSPLLILLWCVTSSALAAFLTV